MTGGGWALRLRFAAALDRAVHALPGAGARRASRSTRARSTSPAAARSSSSPYVDGEELDLRPGRATRSRSRCPPRSCCRADCAGLCPECGADLNEAGPDHRHEAAPDPRWAKLRELKFEYGGPRRSAPRASEPRAAGDVGREGPDVARAGTRGCRARAAGPRRGSTGIAHCWPRGEEVDRHRRAPRGVSRRRPTARSARPPRRGRREQRHRRPCAASEREARGPRGPAGARRCRSDDGEVARVAGAADRRGRSRRRRPCPPAPASSTRAAASGIRVASTMPAAATVGMEVEPGARVEAHGRRALGGEDDPAARAVAVGAARRRGAAGRRRGPGGRSSTAKQRAAPRRPRAASAMRDADHAPVALGDPASRRGRCPARWAIRSTCAGVQLRLVLAGRRREERAPARRRTAPSTSSAAQGGGCSTSARGHPRKSSSRGDSLPWSLAMAVPKQKQSHSRTEQAPRAAQDQRADAQRVPAVPQPAPPAPGLPELRLLRRARGRRADARPRPRPRPLAPAMTTSRSRSTPTAPTSVPPRSPRGAALAAGAAACACCCSARPTRSAPVGRRRRGRRRAGLDRQGRRPGARRARDARRLDRAGRAGRRRRASADALVSRRLDRRRARRRRCSTSSARAASTGRRWRCRCRSPGAPVLLLDVGANVEVAARAPRPVRASWAPRSRAAVLGVERPRVGAAVQRRGGRRRARRGRRRGPRALAERAAAGALRLRRQRRGHRRRARRAPTSIVTDGFTGNVALKVMEGDLADDARRGPRARRCRRTRAKARRRCCCARRCAALRDELDPEGAGRRLPARPAAARRRAARALHARGHSRRRSSSPRAACASDVVGRTHAALEAAGALRRAPAGVRARPSSVPAVMTRDEVLDADPRPTWPTSSSSTPRAIDEATRFKEDLEADSLDLYTLVQELEDTYGVQMSDEEAAQIQTVGPGGRLRARPRAGRPRPEPLKQLARPARRAAARTSRGRSFTHASWTERRVGLLRAARVPRRQRARPGGHRRTCTRGWRPSATAPGG